LDSLAYRRGQLGTYNPRRFSKPKSLKGIAPRFLIAFRTPYGDFFACRGLAIPSSETADGLDYDCLSAVLMSPGPDMPTSLMDALHYVDEMSDAAGMDALTEEADRLGLKLEGEPDLTPADVAVQLWLHNPDALQRKHAERNLTRPRSFEHFGKNGVQQVPLFRPLSEPDIQQLEREMDVWFERKRRGRGCRVYEYDRGEEVWFLVRHAEPLRREGAIEDGESTSVFYRPEKYDVVVYNRERGELRVHAATKGEKELYRQKFGEHLFGNREFFLGEAKYTLEPLRADGSLALVCADIEGMDWAVLKQIEFHWPGANGGREAHKADDVFAYFKARGKEMPHRPQIVRASFLVKFTGVKTPRTVAVRAGNVAQYTRDDDSAAVEEWLVRRGFVVTEGKGRHERVGTAVADA
jgi:hypothetical protein